MTAKKKAAPERRKAAKAAKSKNAKTKAKPKAAPKKKPKLLSGGNPQIPKGYGDAPVKAYIKAIRGWKQGVARRVDALITAAVPKVYKAVKWNSPFYGFGGEGWFATFHVFARYIKVGFFRGTSLRPVPPEASKHPEMRYYNIHENQLDEAQFTAWVKQAAKLPGERM
jgi:hypothetical protein